MPGERDLWRDRVFSCGIEGTYNTLPASLDALLTMDGEAQFEADTVERPVDYPYLGHDDFIHVSRTGTVEFDFDLLGSATVGEAAPHGTVLRACGLAETLEASVSATYNPISSAFESLGAKFWYGDEEMPMTGARGNLEITAAVGNFLRARASLRGNQGTVAAGSAPSVTWGNFQRPIAIETESFQLTVGGTDFDARQVTLNMQNQVGLAEGSEERVVQISNRQPEGEFTIYDPGVAVENFYDAAKNGEELTGSFNVTGAAGKIVTINFVKLRLMYPRRTNLDGYRGYTIPYRALPDAGNDEFEIVMT